ncbi:Gfo/Idh/MocA family protein [Paenibacillus puldeungensis]|uniref:Gfo/Idh/MocA family protein n=1 Tax=Paenibacillus puldeungensis TaxID=696536 RepID=A0ABW3RTZ9_9BACL
MSIINFVVVGYGGMGSYHAHHLIPSEKDRVRVVGTYDISEERQHISKDKGFQVYGSLEEVLSDSYIDAILIATPNDVHKEIAIQALRAGKHVVCEKPVAMNTQELDEIVAIAEETGNVFMVHQNRRWDPDFLIIRQLYQSKRIGDIFQIESRVQGANGIPGDWRHLQKHGGGMLLDWGVHLLDQLLWLVNSPIKSVQADLSYILGDEVDDGFMSYITFENGVKALVEVGTTNYTKLPRWYVKGLEGTAKINDWDLSGEIIAATGRKDIQAPTPIQAGVGLTKTMAPPSEEATEKIAFPEPKADFVPFYQNFYEVVREGAEPIVKNHEVRNVMKVIEEIFMVSHNN